MKHESAGLDGALLDAAVAKALGIPYRMNGACFANPENEPDEPQDLMSTFEPSTYWDHAGPIIERERIGLECEGDQVDPAQLWTAGRDDGLSWSWGPTPLIAAMRAFVASKFGAEIDLP